MATARDKDKPAEASSVGHALASNPKWVVGGVIALAGMVLFKEPLTQLLNRADQVEITTAGVKLSAVKTPLGETVVSNKGQRPAGTPANGRWNNEPESARQFGARLVLANEQAARGAFTPNWARHRSSVWCCATASATSSRPRGPTATRARTSTPPCGRPSTASS